MRATILMFVVGLAPMPANPGGTATAASHEAIARGRRVEIKGHMQRDGSFEARRIRVRDADDASKVEGRVLAIDPDLQRVVIGGFDVSIDTGPIVFDGDRRASLRDLAVGQAVEAKGYWSGHLLHAWRLRIRESAASGGAAAQHETEIEAEIERVERRAGTIVVLGRPVRLAPDGKIADERTRTNQTVWPTSRLRRDDDDQQVAPIQLRDWLTIGGRVGGDLRGERHFARNPDEREPEDSATASGELLASAAFASNLELYARMRTTREFALDDDPETTAGELDLRVLEASLTVDRIAGGPVGFQVGRQRFRDDREWFFDDYLDALRVHVDLPSWRLEAAVASGLFAGPEAGRRREDQRHAIVSLARRLGERTTATAFAIARDDRNRHEQPVWIGGSVGGRVTRALKYWGNAAVRRGHAADAIRLRGWAADSGVAYRLPLPGTPAITAGYATASGDQSRSDGVDRNFRQTGLEDNRARFHGLKRFATYGEVFDPELSNLEIITGGLGVKPSGRTSLDLVYHRYAQRQRRRSLPSNALDATGTGRSAYLGQEVDVIVSVQQFRPVDFSIVAGIFWPGAGVASPPRRAHYWRPEVRFFF